MVDCGDKVLVVAREEGRGRLSGGTISQRNYMVYAPSAMARSPAMRSSTKKQGALEAAGLRE